MEKQYTFLSNFESREDLKEFGDNSLLLYLFDLVYSIEDISIFASEFLVDNPDDKKTDLVYIDKDDKKAIIAQGYMGRSAKESAPSNKACDLNSSVAWLLSRSLKELPTSIKSAATELRRALQDNEINRIELWYVHNCPESINVINELKTAAMTAKNALEVIYPNTKCDVTYVEWGLKNIEDRYKASTTAILINKKFVIDIPGGFEIKGKEWNSYSTTIDASWLHKLFIEHKADLFSANIRDYLGSRQSDKNINNGIKETAGKEPDKFWVYNNGVTAIVNNFSIDEKEATIKIEIDGIAIVNGAQTIGSLGSLTKVPESTAKVPIRFIKANNKELISNIIRYNNRQNKISPADFRSIDNTQRRLKDEFVSYPKKINYRGARRGGSEDKISRDQNDLPYERAVQALAAFHSYPGHAYNKKTQISDSDELYNKFFNENTHAEHIVFAYSLFSAIAKIKLELMKKEKEETLTNLEKEKLDFLRNRGANWLLISALGDSLDVIIDARVPNKFLYRFKNKKGIEEGEEIWKPIIDIGISFKEQLKGPLNEILSNEENNQTSVRVFRSFMESVKKSNEQIYKIFSDEVTIENFKN